MVVFGGDACGDWCCFLVRVNGSLVAVVVVVLVFVVVFLVVVMFFFFFLIYDGIRVCGRFLRFFKRCVFG